MTYSTDYPPGQVSTYGRQLLKLNRMAHITYVGYEGTKFRLAGPLAPILGAQNGLAMLTMSGLASPFENLDVQGARQDGTTWLDSVYNPGEIDCVLETSGLTAADSRGVLRQWFGANSPKKTGRLHVYTPELGEWWADVRQLKSITDQITQGHNLPGKQRLTWAWRNDNAFWTSFDSVSSFTMENSSVIDDFVHAAGELDPSIWDVIFKDGAGIGAPGGYPAYDGDGNVVWSVSGHLANEVVCRRVDGSNATSTTDSQIISVQFKAPPGFDLGGGVYVDIWGRMDSSTTVTAGTNGIRCRIGGGGLVSQVILSSFVGGVEQVLHSVPLSVEPQWNETWTLVCGTSKGVRNFKVMRGQKSPELAARTGSSRFTVIDYTETGTHSQIGSSFRSWGFGVAAGGSLGWLTQVPPPPLQEWSAGDNIVLTQSGFLPLVNRGDQDGWPQYVCYGPGTFTFSDGPAPSDNTVSFGPLLEGQIAVITTTPRLRSVVDLSPALPGQVLDKRQKWLADALARATNNNLPPLLIKYESEFGILPPQGPLYSLLTNRFTQPIPGKSEGLPPEQFQIATSITGGNASSMIVASLTPQRLWPL